MSTVDQTAAETPVALADVRAPHLSAWDRLVDATNPLVPFGQPDPLAADAYVPWCLRCQEAAAGVREHAHVVGEHREFHRSAIAHVGIRAAGPSTWEESGFRIPGLGVRLQGLTSEASPRLVVDLRLNRLGETKSIAVLTIPEIRELVRALEAVVDLATGRDDFDVPAAASSEAHR